MRPASLFRRAGSRRSRISPGRSRTRDTSCSRRRGQRGRGPWIRLLACGFLVHDRRRRRNLGGRNLARGGLAEPLFLFLLLLGEVSLALGELVVGLGQLAVLCGSELDRPRVCHFAKAPAKGPRRRSGGPCRWQGKLPFASATRGLLDLAQGLTGQPLDQDALADLEQHVEHDTEIGRPKDLDQLLQRAIL